MTVHVMTCARLAKRCPYTQQVGSDVFHGHVTALVMARSANRVVGEKAVKIVVIDGHFHIVPVERVEPNESRPECRECFGFGEYDDGSECVACGGSGVH